MSSDLTPARLTELLAAATPGLSRARLEALIAEANDYEREGRLDRLFMGGDLMRALAARVIELEAEVERLREALQAHQAHFRAMQRHATDYLSGPPRGLNEGSFVRQMLYDLDGPEQRKLAAITRAALEPRHD